MKFDDCVISSQASVSYILVFALCVQAAFAPQTPLTFETMMALQLEAKQQDFQGQPSPELQREVTQTLSRALFDFYSNPMETLQTITLTGASAECLAAIDFALEFRVAWSNTS